MKSSAYEHTVTFELKDGRELVCTFQEVVFPGNYSVAWGDCYPDESDFSDPEYTLNGSRIDTDEMPRGLEQVAYVMFDTPDNPNFEFGHDTKRLYGGY